MKYFWNPSEEEIANDNDLVIGHLAYVFVGLAGTSVAGLFQLLDKPSLSLPQVIAVYCLAASIPLNTVLFVISRQVTLTNGPISIIGVARGGCISILFLLAALVLPIAGMGLLIWGLSPIASFEFLILCVAAVVYYLRMKKHVDHRSSEYQEKIQKDLVAKAGTNTFAE